MGFNINIEFKCLGTGEVEHQKVDIDIEKVKFVKDLKIKFEEVINAPVSDQKLVYHGRALNDDSLVIKHLYLRDGDWIRVDFLAKANIPVLKELLNDLKEFSEGSSGNQDSILKLSVKPNGKHNIFLNYDSVAHALENLAFVFFIPWKNAVSVANRHYFVQEGGFDIFMNILKFSHKRYSIDNTVQHTESQQELLQERLKHFNNEQMVLQMHCLSLLWNFSETSDDRKLVLTKGGLHWVLDALLLDPHTKTPYEDEFWEIISINETAVGCLVQYAEFPKTQEIVALDTKIVNKLLFMVESRLNQDTSFYSLYSSQISANTLFCCTGCLSTPRIFVQSNVHRKMLDLTKKLLEEEHDMALRYYCSLFLARVRASPFVELDYEINLKIDEMLELFMEKHEPEEISSWEEHHNYVWVTMIPFVSLLFAGGWFDSAMDTAKQNNCQPQTKHGNPTKELESQHETEFVDGGMGSRSTAIPVNYADVSCAKGLMEMFVPCDEGFHGDSNTSNDTSHVKVPHGSPSIDRNVNCLSNLPQAVKSQESPAKELNVVMYGSISTQRFGIFCLRHMLRLGENCSLIESENLLPYLICLCWYLKKDERELMRQALKKFQQVQPPSLRVIAKSSLAMKDGFERVYIM